MSENSRFFLEETVPEGDCHPGAWELARYIDALRADADMDAGLPRQLVEHVENCQYCQSQILDVHLYLQDPLTEPDTAAAREIFPARKRPLIRLFPVVRIAAAAFVFTLLMTIYFILPHRQSPDPLAGNKPGAAAQPDIPSDFRTNASQDQAPESGSSRTVRPAPPGAKKGNGNRLGRRSAFAVNPNLESMVGSRSRGLVIEVYSPPNHVTLSQGITFSWKEFSHEPLSLTIVNNRNETIFRNQVSGGSFLYRDVLPFGCYYWKLESAAELYYVGKFFVDASLTSPKE
jgi:hypothetical protein